MEMELALLGVGGNLFNFNQILQFLKVTWLSLWLIQSWVICLKERAPFLICILFKCSFSSWHYRKQMGKASTIFA